MDMRKRQPIGVELVKKGVVTEKNIEDALEYQKTNPDKKKALNNQLNILHLLLWHILH